MAPILHADDPLILGQWPLYIWERCNLYRPSLPSPQNILDHVKDGGTHSPNLTHLLTHSLTYSPTHSPTHSSTCSLSNNLLDSEHLLLQQQPRAASQHLPGWQAEHTGGGHGPLA